MEVSLLDAWAALGLAFGAGIISLIPFGLGTTDVALVSLLVVLGVRATDAATIAIGLRLVQTIPLGLIGALSYAYLFGRPERTGGAPQA